MGSFDRRLWAVLLLVCSTFAVVGVGQAAAQSGCDVASDPYCDDTYDQGYCDPTYGWECDPSNTVPPYDDPDPGYCDPTYDWECDPSNTVPLYDPTFDSTTLDCDPYFDTDCFSEEWITDWTIPRSLAFEESSASIEGVITRSDTNDDIDVDQVPFEEVPFIAASRLILGFDALAELGALERMADPEGNELVREIRDRIPSDGLDDDGYRSEIRRLSEDFPLFVDQMFDSGFVVSTEVLDVATDLDADLVDAIAQGETSVVDPGLWLSALADLTVRGGAPLLDEDNRDEDVSAVLGLALLFAPEEAPTTTITAETADETEIAAEATSTVVPTTTAASAAETAAVVRDSEPSSDAPPFILIGSAIAGLLALVAFLLIRRLSSEDLAADVAAQAAEHKLSVNDLLDASRRMTAALDVQQISAIALSETERLVDAEGGLLALRTSDGLTAAHTKPPELFRLESINEGSLRRVVETGQSISTVAINEAVLVEVPMAMAAVPIVSDGTITGVIMVVRVASKPFVRDDLEALEMLAPLVGSAFHAANAHGSATELADVEPMTGLKNRRRLDRDLASTGDGLVAYIMLDVDHFKNFNDINGHAAGDEALRRVAKTLAASVRPGDVVYRYGGEEFCVLLPNTTTAEATDVAERIRAGVEACIIPGEENQPSGTVTVSIGVADTSSKPVSDLVERADAALYEAKHAGRNQVHTDR